MNLQFEVSEQEIDELNNLMKEAGLDSYKDLFNNSLTLFKWASEQVKSGNVIASVDEGAKKYTELQLQALSEFAPSHKKLEQTV